MSGSQIQVFTSQDGEAQLEVTLDRDTTWLSLDQMAILFDRSKSVISRHINNVFKDDELERRSVVAKSATTAADGKTYQVDYFNLDVIISVGYRVKSQRGVQFRQWATRVLKDHLVQGYSLNQRRLGERGDGLASALATIEQGFGGELFYPNVASRAAHLLYFGAVDQRQHPGSLGVVGG